MRVGRSEVLEPVVIDEPTAQALQAPDELVVGDTQNFSVRLLGVDTVTGACRVEVGEEILRGKITDPELQVPKNIYTHALDTRQVVTVTAKPVLKEEKISQLFISDAK
jgi:hypothetical protein